MDALARSAAAWRAPGRRDVGVAAVLTAAMAVAAATAGPADPGARAGCAVVSFGLLALVWRRRRPLTVLSAVCAVALIEALAVSNGNAFPAFLALMVAVYSLAAQAASRPLAAGLVLAVTVVSVGQFVSFREYSHADAIPFFVALLVGAPALLGRLSGVRRRLAGSLRQAAEQLGSPPDQQVRDTVARERDRLVREAELVVLDGLEALRPLAAVRTLEEVAAVERIARGRLSDMRRFLGDLRGRDELRRPVEVAPVLREQIEAALAQGQALSAGQGDLAGAGSWARWTAIRPVSIDSVVALGSVGLAVVLAGTRMLGAASLLDRLAQAALVAAIAVPLVWARRRPLAAAAACFAATIAFVLVAAPLHPFDALVAVPLLMLAPLVADWPRERALTALDAERARLGRELHDAVGHAMTVLVLQAAAARRVWQSDLPLAAEHVRVLRETVSEMLRDLRPLVLSLALADTRQTLALAGLPQLAERARTCGLQVKLDIAAAALPSSVAATTYCIVQEALTNAARHAPGSCVVVRITDAQRAVRIEVSNDASASSPGALAGAGQGLHSMAERAAACGGTLDAGPSLHGGFTVIALLPREAEA